MSARISSGYLGLFRSQFGLLAIGFVALFTSSLGQSFFIGLFQTDIARQLDLTAGQFGSAYAVITMISGFMVLYFGAKMDWISPKRYALIVLISLILGVLLLTLSPWFILALFGFGLVRLTGQGLMIHFGITLIGREFTVNRGRALGVVTLGMPVSEILLPPLIAIAIGIFTWQQIWWAIAAVIVVLWIVLFMTVPWPNTPEIQRDSSGKQIKGPNPMIEKRFWLLVPLMMALPITLTGLFIFQAQMTLDLNATTTGYALGLMAMGIARFPGALMGGRWVDEWGVNLLAKLYLVPFAISIILAVWIGGNFGIILLMIGAGISLGMSSPVVDSLLVVLWGRAHLGRVRSVKSALMVFTTGLAPAVLGFMIDAAVQFEMILLGMLGLMVGGWLLALAPIREANTVHTDAKH